MTPAPRSGHADAARAVELMRKTCEGRSRAGVIAIADSHGDLVAFLRMDGAALSSIDIAINKAFTAARVGTTTRELGAAARHPDSAFDVGYYGSHRFIGWGGGVPVRFGGEVVGGVAVSGLTEAEDEEIANIGAAVLVEALAAAGT